MLLASGELISEHRSQFVLFASHGLRQTLLERRSNFILLAERFPEFAQLLDHLIFVELVQRFVFYEQLPHLFKARIDLGNRLFRIGIVEGGHGGGLRPMKENKGSVLFVTHGPLFVRRVVAADIHQRQRMIRVLDGTVIMLEAEPRDSAMVVLDEFAVGFEALVFVHDKVFVPLFDFQHAVEERRVPLDLLSIGTTLSFHLQNSKIDSHLDYVATVVSLDQADGKRMRVKSPIPEDFVQPFWKTHGDLSQIDLGNVRSLFH